MKITASLLSVFVGVGVGVASAGDSGLRSTDQRILGSPEIEAGNGAVTTGADISGGSDCDSISDAICNLGDQYSTMCDIIKNETAMSSMDFGTKEYTVFIPDDTAWTLFQPSMVGLSDEEVGRIVSFHFYEGIDLTYDELDCGETLTAVTGDTSRTKCDQGHGDDIKHQNGNGNTIQESLPTITNLDIDFCNGVAHTIDHLMLPVHLEEFVPVGSSDPGFGLDPTCDPSPDCVPRYGNGQQLTFCCITDDQWEPGLIGNDDLGGDPGFGIDPNQCDGIYTVLQYLKCIVECSNECVPRYNNDVQLVFCCLTDGQWIGNDDMGGDPGFGSLRRVSDLPSCTDVDPVISADVTSAVIPLELLRQYTGTSPTTPPYVVSFEDKDQGGMVDVVTDPPTPCEDSTILSNSALWCNTKGQQIIRAQTHGMCLQDSDPEYYYIKFVSTNYFATTGVCTLLRVSRNAPGTWTEYQTESMPTTGGAIEWVYNDEDVGKRFKYSLCPDTVDDKNIVKVVVTTFE